MEVFIRKVSFEQFHRTVIGEREERKGREKGKSDLFIWHTASIVYGELN